MQTRKNLAKHCPPRLHAPVERQALFDLLDHAEPRPLCWVSGPPGSGKTTLVASYLISRDVPTFWYHVDPADADLAAIFAGLRDLAMQFGDRSARSLPYLTPEYRHDVSAFQRRFFRGFFAAMPTDGVLVFDNCQDAASDQFSAMLNDATMEMPPVRRIFAISRHALPAALARQNANGAVALIDWGDLRLSVAEVGDIVRAHGLQSRVDAQALHRVSDGWAAGVVLLLANRANHIVMTQPSLDSKEAIFHYFAEEVLSRSPLSDQALLMQTSLLPQFSLSMADALSESTAATRVLSEIYANRYFLDRRGDVGATFEYHPLFREFLLERLVRTVTSVELNRLRKRAALTLEENGYVADAADLLTAAQDWPMLATLIRKHSPNFFNHGRFQTVRAWAEAIPQPVRANLAWVEFWRGLSHLQMDQDTALEILEGAYAGFKESRDSLGQCLTICSIVDAYYFRMGRFQGLQQWVTELEMFVDPPAGAAFAPEVDLRANTAMLTATTLVRPDHPMLSRCADTILRYLESNIDLEHKIPGALCLMYYSAILADTERGKVVLRYVMSWLDLGTVAPLVSAFCMNYVGYFLFLLGRDIEALEVLEKSIALAQGHGLPICAFQGTYFLLLVHAANARTRDVEVALSALERIPAYPYGAIAKVQLKYASAKLAIAREDYSSAQRLMGEAAALADDTGVVFFRVMSYVGEAACYWRLGDGRSARAALQHGWILTQNNAFSVYQPLMNVVRGGISYREGRRDAARAELQEAFGGARRLGVSSLVRCPTYMLGESFAAAMKEGIEPEFVRSAIRELHIPPVSFAAREWPWPIRIHALGKFSLEIDGVPFTKKGKAQHRVLGLLRILVAHGGRNVSAHSIRKQMWPGAEGDTENTLSTTLSRLRKLLMDDDTIVHRDGRLTLNDRLCWVDVWSFDHVATPGRKDRISEDSAASELVGLYRGPLLQGEVAPWAVSPRESLRMRFIFSVLELGQTLEREGRSDRALALYFESLEREAFAERIYERLIRLLRSLGREADAREVYRRCRHIWATHFGVLPTFISAHAIFPEWNGEALNQEARASDSP